MADDDFGEALDALDRVTAERDAARDIAVALEQENAILIEAVRRFDRITRWIKHRGYAPFAITVDEVISHLAMGVVQEDAQ